MKRTKTVTEKCVTTELKLKHCSET